MCLGKEKWLLDCHVSKIFIPSGIENTKENFFFFPQSYAWDVLQNIFRKKEVKLYEFGCCTMSIGFLYLYKSPKMNCENQLIPVAGVCACKTAVPEAE